MIQRYGTVLLGFRNLEGFKCQNSWRRQSEKTTGIDKPSRIVVSLYLCIFKSLLYDSKEKNSGNTKRDAIPVHSCNLSVCALGLC